MYEEHFLSRGKEALGGAWVEFVARKEVPKDKEAPTVGLGGHAGKKEVRDEI